MILLNLFDNKFHVELVLRSFEWHWWLESVNPSYTQ